MRTEKRITEGTAPLQSCAGLM